MYDASPVSSGCAPLDDLLDGGFERGTVTQLYGPPAAGKTNIALQAAAQACVDDSSVLYIDTEGVSFERFRQLVRGIDPDRDPEAVASKLSVSAAHSFEEQAQAVKRASDLAPEVSIIVLDSASGFYRVERIDETEDATGDTLRRLGDQIAHLLGLARRYNLAVIITNQVFTDPDTDRVRPLGGYTLEHWCGTILRIERFRGGRRKVTLEKHRSRGVGESVTIEITDTGIVGMEGP